MRDLGDRTTEVVTARSGRLFRHLVDESGTTLLLESAPRIGLASQATLAVRTFTNAYEYLGDDACSGLSTRAIVRSRLPNDLAFAVRLQAPVSRT